MKIRAFDYLQLCIYKCQFFEIIRFCKKKRMIMKSFKIEYIHNKVNEILFSIRSNLFVTENYMYRIQKI